MTWIFCKSKALNRQGLQVADTISILYYKNTPLERALDRLFVARWTELTRTGPIS